MINQYIYSDETAIELLPNNKFIMTLNNERLYLNEIDKPLFQSGTGETVVEYTGLDSDGNSLRSIAKACYLPKAYSPLHYHAQRTEFYYIIFGTAQVTINNTQHLLFPGDCICIPQNQQHQVVNDSSDSELILIVKCSPSWVKTDYHLVTR